MVKPKPRLLNLNVDDLQTFANALHNQTLEKEPKKPLTDLSDVNLDGDEEEEVKIATDPKNKQISDKFYSNLQAPFHPLLGVDRASSESEIWCKENEVSYKVSTLQKPILLWFHKAKLKFNIAILRLTLL